MPVHQFLPTLSRGDAIGNHVLRIQPLLERFGPSKVYVERSDVWVPGVVEYCRDHSPADRAAILYHASIGTPLARYLMGIEAPLIVDYHNVTPMHFYAAFEPRVAVLLHAGRSECRALASRARLGIADSDYSARELDAMGYPSTATIPILIDVAKYEAPPDARLLRHLQATKGGAEVLFVGRLSPNKRQEDVVKAFSVYRRHFDRGARLFLVGRTSSSRYRETLERFIDSIGAEGIHLAGSVSDPEFHAYYRAADVFLSMSEHEGFCVPLLESMKFEVPIIAFAAGAVPETLGDAGILVGEKNYDEIAALIHLAVTDGSLRERLVAAGRARLDHFRPERHEGRLLELIESALE